MAPDARTNLVRVPDADISAFLFASPSCGSREWDGDTRRLLAIAAPVSERAAELVHIAFIDPSTRDRRSACARIFRCRRMLAKPRALDRMPSGKWKARIDLLLGIGRDSRWNRTARLLFTTRTTRTTCRRLHRTGSSYSANTAIRAPTSGTASQIA